METWRLISSGHCSPAYNMAVDEAILTAHAEGKVPPTLRFYGWNPATLSIGYFQKVSEIDHEVLQRSGYGFVRRATGGRAVLHEHELTYSLVVREDHPDMPSAVVDAYRVISRGLLEGYRRLGVQAELHPVVDQHAQKNKWSTACFDMPSAYELVVNGRKAAGSAQMRHLGAILQHGAILLDFDAASLIRLISFPDEDARDHVMHTLEDHAIALHAALGRTVSYEEAEHVFRAGFEQGFGVHLKPGRLTEYEETLVRTLEREKYGNASWNFRC